MRQILSIAKITLLESIRDRIFTGLLVFLCLFLGFAVYISTLSLGTPARFIENSGMLGISLLCLLVTILFGMFSLYREQERKETYILLNRLPRSKYLLGRFLGSTLIIAIFSLVTGLGVFLITGYFGGKWEPALFWASYWALLEFSLLTAIGIFYYSLGVSFTLNSLLLLFTFVIGHSLNEAIQSFIGLGRLGNHYYLMFVKTISILIPNFDMFNFRLAIVHGRSPALPQVALSSAYWLFYLCAILTLSAVVINRRDL